jgi:hypothetical protein
MKPGQTLDHLTLTHEEREAVLADLLTANARMLVEDHGLSGLASHCRRNGLSKCILAAARVTVDLSRGVRFDGAARDHA